MTETNIERCQRILNREGGDISKAMTYAAFRISFVGALRNTWPTVLDRTSQAHHARLTDRPRCADRECGRDTDGGEFCPRCRKRQQRERDHVARQESA